MGILFVMPGETGGEKGPIQGVAVDKDLAEVPPIAIDPLHLDPGEFAEGEIRGKALGHLTVGLAELRRIDAIEANFVSFIPLENRNRIAVMDADNLALDYRGVTRLGEGGQGKEGENENG